MDLSAINVRYAKAFFSAAKESSMLDQLKSDIQLVMDVCKNSSEFILLLDSPVVKASKKIKLIGQIFQGKVQDITLGFLSLIVKNKREAHIPAICRNFIDLVRKDQNIKSATLITATTVSDEVKEKIKQLLEKQFNSKVELEDKVEEKIIGGLILRMDDKQFDASVATRLANIKHELLETELK
ncbi:MAG: ATP synthase F1 subunit delta [Draconibacterium sp.]|nr:MAG: ATP synthase F1 subunit delta [Draconibacterium sp.]